MTPLGVERYFRIRAKCDRVFLAISNDHLSYKGYKDREGK